ncbi:sporulation protein YlmC with PRC-barrel domain [Paraburkholderia sp. GAS448]|uniref:PRC-barrel domain-containing protein n=1 Tax=Paraburkholderia sp. GAS448 TaxID=3035136 RepID=UPI003D2401DE
METAWSALPWCGRVSSLLGPGTAPYRLLVPVARIVVVGCFRSIFTLTGNELFTSDREDIGKISENTLDVRGGRIAYAVLSSGGFLGMGDRLFAIPWSALTLDTDEKCFRLDVTADRLKNAPAFDKDHWLAMADPLWGSSLHQYYDRQPYWLATRDFAENHPLEH